MSYPVEAVTIDAIRKLPPHLIREYLVEALHSDLDGCYEYEKQCIHRFLADMITYVEQCKFDSQHEDEVNELVTEQDRGYDVIDPDFELNQEG